MQILLKRIDKPLGVGSNPSFEEAEIFIQQCCDIQVYKRNKILFTEVLFILCDRIDGCIIDDKNKFNKRIDRQLGRKFFSNDPES